MHSSVESCNNPEADKTSKKWRLMLAPPDNSRLFSLGSRLLDQAVGRRGCGRFCKPWYQTRSRSVCKSRSLYCPDSDQKSPIDLGRVAFANMHTLAGSFSKPRFFFLTVEAYAGCFSLGIDSKVMYGKSSLNICIWLENTLVLDHYPGRLSKKGVFVGLEVILNDTKSPKGRKAVTLQPCFNVNIVSRV